MRHKKTKQKFIWIIAASLFCAIVLFGTAESKKADVKKEYVKTESVNKDSPESAASETNVQEQSFFSKDYSEDEFRPQVEEVSYVWSFFKMLIILGIMVGIFYYFFKFVSKKANINNSPDSISKTLSVIPIAQNKFLQVVDLGGKILVLGVSDNSINLVTEITEKHEIDKIRVSSSTDSQTPSNTSFGDFFRKQVGHILDRVSNRGEKRFESASEHDYGYEQKIDLEYLKRQRGRLKKLNGVSHE